MDWKDKRFIKPTLKGQGLYQSTLDTYLRSLRRAWKEIENILIEFDDSTNDIRYLRKTETAIENIKEDYIEAYESLISFLTRTRSEESYKEMDFQTTRHQKCRDIIDNFVRQIHDLSLMAAEVLSEKLETRSEASVTTELSVSERVKLRYVRKETELQKQKELLEAKMELLAKEQRVAEIEAEIDDQRDRISDRKPSPPCSADEPIEVVRRSYTADYISKFSDDHTSYRQRKRNNDLNLDSNKIPCDISTPAMSNRPASLNLGNLPLNPSAQEFYPQNGLVTNFTQFLLKKDILLSRFSPFNDRAESYQTWKATFSAIVKELNVSPFEEMDLLVKWLGPESKRFANSIRSSNINDPTKGLFRIWERLEERYGKPEMIEAALKNKLNSFPKISLKDSKKLYDLLDILTEIESVKENPQYATLLSYYDSSSGVNPIICKLPLPLQNKWVSQAAKYKKYYSVPFPPFSFLVDFIREISSMKNDPALQFDGLTITSTHSEKRLPELKRSTGSFPVHTRKTDLVTDSKEHLEKLPRCPIHKANHSLNHCRAFRVKPLQERRDLLRQMDFCYKCCEAKHLSRNCTANIKCELCGSSRHATALHPDQPKSYPKPADGGERVETKVTDTRERIALETTDGRDTFQRSDKVSVSNMCTRLCGVICISRSCAKIIPVRIHTKDNDDISIKVYAIIDEQSNRTLAKSELFDFFNIRGDAEETYTLFSCSGQSTRSGRRASGLVVEALDKSCQFNLPTIIECDEIPDNRCEIATPEVAEAHPYLREIAHYLIPLDDECCILLLIGRDLAEAHHVLEQRIGPPDGPFAQKLHLGWVIIGEVCVGKSHRPDVVVANKLAVLPNGRSTQSIPCPSNIVVKEDSCMEKKSTPSIGSNIFQTSDNDEKPGLSVEDKIFLDIMDKNTYRDDSGQWVAPLPFREPRPRLGNNRQLAVKRANMLNLSLQKNPTKCVHAVAFMKRIFDAGHAELAPPLKDKEEFWYLPIFSVYHSKKPDQIRMVFDSSAQHDGLSLNNVLLTGPDLTNSLLGVLLRFRVEKIGIMADIQQMFHCFKVREDHRNYLRFFWYADNDPKQRLVEYRMCVHVFGNSPSPAVATYGLRKTAHNAEPEFGGDVQRFVDRNFYVDDGLISLPSVEEAVSLMQRTQRALLQEGGLRLHKIVSNSCEVMKCFPTEDLAKDLTSLDLTKDSLPTQRTLGISWDLPSDSFSFNLSPDEKPYTRRGVLSCLNSFYDPLGFVTPVLIKGKLLLRKLTSESMDWDLPLPDEYHEEWERWKQQLHHLKDLKIPRCYLDVPTQGLIEKTVHVFTDASKEAIAAVAFLRAKDIQGYCHHGFILGKGKVAPKSAVTIPRLELCAAVLGVEISRIIKEQLDITPKDFQFHTDSKVVLGYIYNKTRRFYTYVSNRIEQIHRFSSPAQWSYIPSHHNPADQGTKPILPEAKKESLWLRGPKFWTSKTPSETQGELEGNLPDYDLVDSDKDNEIRPIITTKKTNIGIPFIGTSRFAKYSTWNSLVAGISRLKHIARHWSKGKEASSCNGWHSCNESKDVELYRETEKLIIQNVQREAYQEEIRCIREGRTINKRSTLSKLNPVIDPNGILRVGGRLNQIELHINEKNPIIMPGGKHPISILLIRHYHHLAKHQGRHFTDGAVRSAGFWIVGAKRLISSVIFNCVTCRKLRRKPEHQIMADLPKDRLSPGPPFTSVGVDTFGPWVVAARRTRGGIAHAKRWAIMFSCLVSRAVHIEVVEEMSSSSLINALRRFIAIRGYVKEFRSDRGTNFVGSTDDLGIHSINVEDGPIKKFLLDNRTVWIFNPPHSSHMGGAWERMIGLTRRILDSLLMTESSTKLTHETLVTFLAEASAIINSRPLVPVSTDPEYPLILTPYTLLTQKTDKGEEPLGPFDEKDIYKAQWKRVQQLAEIFWKRWKTEYLITLQNRQKWPRVQTNLSIGDVVLMKDNTANRCDWKHAVVERVFPSTSDEKVRTVELRVNKDGSNVHYIRPVTETVLLVPV